jgi:hypothetical protein
MCFTGDTCRAVAEEEGAWAADGDSDGDGDGDGDGDRDRSMMGW